jgi:signal transduction histidine kinase
VITDITENRKLQWQAIRSARLASLGVLSAGIAHEINNPNHAILANASLLARIWQDALPILNEYEQEQGAFLLAGLSFAQAREIISRGMNDIGQNAKRIQKIVDNLKHLGKQDRGHMDEAGRYRESAAGRGDAARNPHPQAHRSLCPGPARGAADGQGQCAATGTGVHQRHRQCPGVAARAQPVGQGFGEAGQCRHRIIVEVVDQGKGIAEDVMAQIGEPFFTTKAESGGTGLGLSISSSIVEKHGGALRFEPNSDLRHDGQYRSADRHGGVNERKVLCQSAGFSGR